MHIHPSSPNSDCSLLLDHHHHSEEESIAADAAIKIQAGFRGYRVRKQIYTNQRSSQRTHRHHPKSPAIMSVPNETSASAAAKAAGCINGVAPSAAAAVAPHGNGDGASIEDRCATKIQAGVRGYLVRKKQKIASDAATKIQAGFRGFKARKEAQKLKQK